MSDCKAHDYREISLTLRSTLILAIRPTSETRAKLLQDVNRICENCRVSVRSIRHQAQKQIKGDVKSGTIGEDEGFRKLKAVDETAMKSTREVDDLQAGLKKKIEKEDA